jgi:hypothetical protein
MAARTRANGNWQWRSACQRRVSDLITSVQEIEFRKEGLS